MPTPLVVTYLLYLFSGLSVSVCRGGVGVWTGDGPRAKSVEAIARDPLNPLRMWAATFGGGVSRSLDGGATWSPQRAGLVNTFVRCLAVQPNHPDSVYCGANDGVYLSLDGGLVWNRVLSTSQSVRAITLHPIRTKVVFAATYGSGIYKSFDGGSTWSTINLGLGNTIVRDIAIHPTKPDTLIAGTGTGTVSPPGPGGLFRSVNGGLSWAQLADTTGSGNGTHGAAEQIRFDLLDPLRVYAAEAERGVLKSADGGATWTRTNLGLTTLRSRALALADTARYLGTDSTTGGGAYVTTLSDLSWHPVLSGVQIDAMLAMDSAPGTAWAGTDGKGIYRTDNRGASWSQLDGGLLNTLSFSLAVQPLTHAVYDGTGFGDQFWHSGDHGVTWTRATTLSSHDSEHGVAADPVVAGRVYLSAYGAGVFRSDDDGATWSNPDTTVTLTNPFVRDLVTWPGVTGRLFAGTGIGPFESLDGGSTWLSRVGNLPPSFGVHAMSLVPGTPFTMYVGSDLAGVYKTVNGGAAWTPQNTGLPGVFVHALHVDFNNPSVIYAGLGVTSCPSCYGVFKSSDAGATWAPARAGLPVSEVRVIAQDLVHPGALFCGTYGAGVFQSVDGGANWQPVGNQTGLADLRVRALAVDGELRTIYAGTENGVAAFSQYDLTDATRDALTGLYLRAGPVPSSGPLTVDLVLTAPSPTTVDIFNAAGAHVRSLATNVSLSAGPHTLTWDRRNDRASSVGPGVYFVRLTTVQGARVSRAVLLGR